MIRPIKWLIRGVPSVANHVQHLHILDTAELSKSTWVFRQVDICPGMSALQEINWQHKCDHVTFLKCFNGFSIALGIKP